MAVKIRPIVLQDAASYSQCFNAVAKEGRHFAVFKGSPLATVRANLRKRIRKKVPFLVAVDGHRVVGWAAVFRPDTPSLSHNGDLILGVLSEYRGLGLGTKLGARILKAARGKFETLLFSFFDKNKAARKLSKRLGFELCGRERNFVKFAHGFDDQVITQMMLRR